MVKIALFSANVEDRTFVVYKYRSFAYCVQPKTPLHTAYSISSGILNHRWLTRLEIV